MPHLPPKDFLDVETHLPGAASKSFCLKSSALYENYVAGLSKHDDPQLEYDDQAAGNDGGDQPLIITRSFQMFESYWPSVGKDPNAPQDARRTANELNQMTKVVFSRTLKEVTWENTQLVKADLGEEVKKLKQKELYIWKCYASLRSR